MTAAHHFTPATFAFMRELAANNNREWFNANKPRYEGVPVSYTNLTLPTILLV